MNESLAIEISKNVPAEWRVVERTHRTTESACRISHSPEDLAGLLKEIAARLGDADSAAAGDNLSLNRLGARLAEMCLPAPLRKRLASHSGPVDFFLDDESVALPVELFPNQGGVLAENVPATRHWFCESAPPAAPPPARRKRQALIVADPARNLPAARKEGTAVHRFFGRRKEWQCRCLVRAATAVELSRELPETDLLHLAAHYEAGKSGEQSGVAVTGGRWLPSGASPAPDLVFANCCRAGLPAGDGGDLSLAGHFLKRGARHVIAPFLPVPDETALKFAAAFYAALDRDADVANAVLSARKALGPAGWMYWHFGPASGEPVQKISPPVGKRSGKFGKLFFVAALALAAVFPWLKPADKNPVSGREVPAGTEEPPSAVLRPDEPMPETIEPVLTLPEPGAAIAVEQTPPVSPRQPAAAKKPGLFDEALAEAERRQTFADAAIAVLAGYPEKYLSAAVKGKPEYDAAGGRASVAVEVAIDNEMYRAMALRLSETLKEFGHAGERIPATMQRPYDSFLEVRFQFSGRKRFRDVLLLCLRANDALTRSEWEFYSLPGSSIDAILSSMAMPVLSVALIDHSGQIAASASEKISKPFSATDARCFRIFPVFDDGSANLAATSLIPGRNRLEVKLEFDLSMEEIGKIANAVCTVEKGNDLPEEFRYRFLR